MLRRWRDRLNASLGTHAACVRLTRLNAHGRSAVCEHRVNCGAPAADIVPAIEAFDQALRETIEHGHDIAGLRCDIAVDDVWMLYDIIESDLDEVPRRAADDLVGAALADAAGLPPGDIVVRWQHHGERSVACALPASTLRALQGVVQRYRVQLGSVAGEFALAYDARRHALRSGRSLLAVTRTAGTQLGLVIDGALVATCFEPRVADPALLVERGRALLHAHGYEDDDSTRYCADRVPPVIDEPPWSREIPPVDWPRRFDPRAPTALGLDLSPTRTRVRPSSWALLAVGTLAIAIAGVQFQTASGQHLRETRALRALEESLADARTGHDGRKGRAGLQETPDMRAAVAVVRELQVPWGKLFTAFETVARQDVALLSVEPSAAKQEVRIVAEAKSTAAMLDFLDALRTEPLRRVTLDSHQVQAQTPGAPVRFQARATWESR